MFPWSIASSKLVAMLIITVKSVDFGGQLLTCQNDAPEMCFLVDSKMKNVTAETDIFFTQYSNKGSGDGKIRRIIKFLLRRPKMPKKTNDESTESFFLNPLRSDEDVPVFNREHAFLNAFRIFYGTNFNSKQWTHISRTVPHNSSAHPSSLRIPLNQK